MRIKHGIPFKGRFGASQKGVAMDLAQAIDLIRLRRNRLVLEARQARERAYRFSDHSLHRRAAEIEAQVALLDDVIDTMEAEERIDGRTT